MEAAAAADSSIQLAFRRTFDLMVFCYGACGGRHCALTNARSFAFLFQFGMLRLVFGFVHVFFVSLAMSHSRCW